MLTSSLNFSPSITVGFSGQERNLGAIECLERKWLQPALSEVLSVT